jgi:hypothetical protein
MCCSADSEVVKRLLQPGHPYAEYFQKNELNDGRERFEGTHNHVCVLRVLFLFRVRVRVARGEFNNMRLVFTVWLTMNFRFPTQDREGTTCTVN